MDPLHTLHAVLIILAVAGHCLIYRQELKYFRYLQFLVIACLIWVVYYLLLSQELIGVSASRAIEHYSGCESGTEDPPDGYADPYVLFDLIIYNMNTVALWCAASMLSPGRRMGWLVFLAMIGFSGIATGVIWLVLQAFLPPLPTIAPDLCVECASAQTQVSRFLFYVAWGAALLSAYTLVYFASGLTNRVTPALLGRSEWESRILRPTLIYVFVLYALVQREYPNIFMQTVLPLIRALPVAPPVGWIYITALICKLACIHLAFRCARIVISTDLQ
jgi:hypothetical protein